MGVLNGVALLLGASMLFCLALRARSLGLVARGRTTLFVATAALLIAFSVCFRSNDALGLALFIAGGAIVTVVSVQGALAAARVRAEANDAELGPRLRWLGVGFVALSIQQCATVVVGFAGDTTAVAVVALVSFVLFALVTCVFMSSLARQHSQRGRDGLAWFARSLVAWSVVALSSPLLAWTGSLVAGVAMILAVLLPIVMPFATRMLVGAGPLPLELFGPAEPKQPNVIQVRAALATLFCVALGVQLMSFGRHHARCGGLLVPAQAEEGWRALPVLATGDQNKLGPFNFRAYHFNWKNYPSAYGDAALSDPHLCFGSTISLVSWFDGDMYRSPTELQLRESQGTGVFVVSVLVYGQDEKLIAAFKRHEEPTSEFDSPLSRNYVLVGFALLGAGVACAALWVRLSRAGRASDGSARAAQVASFAFLIASLVCCVVLENIWASDSTPRPGRELAEEHGWLI